MTVRRRFQPRSNRAFWLSLAAAAVLLPALAFVGFAVLIEFSEWGDSPTVFEFPR